MKKMKQAKNSKLKSTKPIPTSTPPPGCGRAIPVVYSLDVLLNRNRHPSRYSPRYKPYSSLRLNGSEDSDGFTSGKQLRVRPGLLSTSDEFLKFRLPLRDVRTRIKTNYRCIHSASPEPTWLCSNARPPVIQPAKRLKRNGGLLSTHKNPY